MQNARDKRFCDSASKLTKSGVEDLASTKRYQPLICPSDGAGDSLIGGGKTN
jgi:hypothetical protein